MKMDSNQFKRIFEAFDKNMDGKISNFELSGLLSTFAITKKAEETLRAIMDGNGDGFMDIDEFMEAIGETGSESELHDLRDAFAVFDNDGDGKISAEDLQLVLVSLGCNKYGPEECSRMIKGVDQDGDGFVDFQEFRLMMTKGASIQCLLNL
ncbi:hypothetical protein FNV43_RR18247 [Rhamnella rubrinervis]|uniref:EF-hand domain-containing protein n=1 Tax=Rhamnella rubrinervis TaxID=2594499 RepID=A0A8K0E5Y3_9ROSA|nr:hypothetical protein FNV43_RR18247 [Rhamnella rubrinervis]